MAEYIMRDKLWDTFASEPFYDNADKEEIVLPIIDSFPAVDVAPIVRCKNCKYHRMSFKRDMCAKNAVVLDNREVGLRGTKADDFCSYGERLD